MGLIKFKGKTSAISNDAQRMGAPSFKAQFTGGKHRPNDEDAIYAVNRPGGWQTPGRTRDDRPSRSTDYPIQKPAYKLCPTFIPVVSSWYDSSQGRHYAVVIGQSNYKTEFVSEDIAMLMSQLGEGLFCVRGKFYKIQINVTNTVYTTNTTTYTYEKKIWRLNESSAPIDLSNQLSLVPSEIKPLYDDLYEGNATGGLPDTPTNVYPLPAPNNSMFNLVKYQAAFCASSTGGLGTVGSPIPSLTTQAQSGSADLSLGLNVNSVSPDDVRVPDYWKLASEGIQKGALADRIANTYRVTYHLRSIGDYQAIFNNSNYNNEMQVYPFFALTYQRTTDLRR
jgi:hypothetical protein